MVGITLLCVCVWVSEWVRASKWVSETACLPACLSKAAYHIDRNLGKIDESLKSVPFCCHVQNYTKDVYFEIKVKDIKFSASVVYLIIWVRVSHHHWSSQLTRMANVQCSKFVIDSLLLLQPAARNQLILYNVNTDAGKLLMHWLHCESVCKTWIANMRNLNMSKVWHMCSWNLSMFIIHFWWHFIKV